MPEGWSIYNINKLTDAEASLIKRGSVNGLFMIVLGVVAATNIVELYNGAPNKECKPTFKDNIISIAGLPVGFFGVNMLLNVFKKTFYSPPASALANSVAQNGIGTRNSVAQNGIGTIISVV